MSAGPSGGLRDRQLMLSLYLPAIASGLGQGITAPVIPLLAQSFGVSAGIASLVFIMHMAGAAAATMPTGFLLDKIGRRKILLAGPIISALGSFAIFFAGSFEELLVYRFIAGWGQQMWMLSRLTVIADTGGDYQRGQQITSMFGAQRVGMLLGPLVGGFTGAAWGPEIPFVIHGIVLLLTVIPSFYIVRETIPAAVPEHKHAVETGTLRAMLKHPIPIVFLVQMLANTARGGIEGGGILFLYAAYAYGAGPITLGVLSSVMAGVGIPITLAAGKVMDSQGRKFTIVPGSLFVGAAMMFMGATWFFSLPFNAYIAGFVALHLGGSVMTGSMQTLGTDIAPAHARGVFFGVGRLVGQTGRLASPTSFGLLAEMVSFGVAFMFLASMSVAGGIVMALFVKETLGARAVDADKADAADPSG